VKKADKLTKSVFSVVSDSGVRLKA